MTPSRQSQRGLSLLELLVAFVIMASSLAVLYQASGGSVRAVGEVDRRLRAVALAESLLNEKDSVPPEGWQGRGEWDVYRWRVASEPFSVQGAASGAASLHRVEVEVAWSDERSERRILLATLRPQRVVASEP